MTDPQSLIDTATDIHEAATPGPWDGDQSAMSVSQGSIIVCSHIETNDDVNFIATARTLVPELAAALKEILDKRNAELDDAWPGTPIGLRSDIEQRAIAGHLRGTEVRQLTRERDEAREGWAKSVVNAESALSAAQAFRSIYDTQVVRIRKMSAEIK